MDDDYLIGTVFTVPYNFTPRNTLPCNGQALSIQQYTMLYSLIGIRFGGNGISTFFLPNLQGFEPNPYVHYVIMVENGMYPMRP